MDLGIVLLAWRQLTYNFWRDSLHRAYRWNKQTQCTLLLTNINTRVKPMVDFCVRCLVPIKCTGPLFNFLPLYITNEAETSPKHGDWLSAQPWCSSATCAAESVELFQTVQREQITVWQYQSFHMITQHNRHQYWWNFRINGGYWPTVSVTVIGLTQAPACSLKLKYLNFKLDISMYPIFLFFNALIGFVHLREETNKG